LIGLFLMLTIAVTIVALPLANANDPAWEMPTYAYIALSPDPIGINQPVTAVFWIDKIPPTAAGIAGDRWKFYLDITNPEGTKQTVGPLTSDPVGGSWYTYTPDQVGSYTFTVRFGPQLITGSDGTGIYNYNIAINDTYLASSATEILTVQEEAIPDPPIYPLPSEYWTRPIEGQNTQWSCIASNWLRSPQIVGRVQPNGIAPNSAHVMWTKPIAFGGVVGDSYEIPGLTFYDGTAYESPFSNPLIMYGRLYYDLPQSDSSSGGGYICVDLRTGEEIWYNDYGFTEVTYPGFGTFKSSNSPSFGQLFDYESMNQHGVIRNGYLWNNAWNAYDPLTGNWLFNLTGVPSGTNAYGPNGEILRYVLNVQGKWLALWNNTAVHGLTGAMSPTDTTSSSYYQWRPVGKTADASQAYSWNVTASWLPAGSTVVAILQDDVLLGRAGSLPGPGTWTPYTMWAMSLKPNSRGQMMWMKDYNAPEGNISRMVGPFFMGEYLESETRIFTMYDKETLQWWGYDLDSGNYVWGPTESEASLNYYSDVGLPRYDVYKGKLYSVGMSGMVYCYDHGSGELLWNYTTGSSGLDSPWTNWPLGLGAIADDKVYVFTSEHSANAPHWVGVKMRCINATNGEEVWTLDTYGSQGSIAIADGYMIYLNLYDMQIYCIGKGPSATTVTATPKVSTHGDTVLVEGTVIDIAAGTEQNEQAARFPSGVPAMSDESVSDWMAYVYMQKPLPTDATGVEVVLETLDPNGNYYEIGRTTSDAKGAFGCTFTPEVPGLYTIIATFKGSESYYGSVAETFVNVEEAPQASPTPTPPPPGMTDTYVLGIGAGAIIAIIVVGLVIILMLRKK
jgi:outer membrane protein assembly factor BamB